MANLKLGRLACHKPTKLYENGRFQLSDFYGIAPHVIIAIHDRNQIIVKSVIECKCHKQSPALRYAEHRVGPIALWSKANYFHYLGVLTCFDPQWPILKKMAVTCFA
jgi:hypothetical protein